MARKRRETVRFTLGMLQMAAATVAVVLLVQTGVTTWTLVAMLLASVLTTISVMLFGARRPRVPSHTHLSRRR